MKNILMAASILASIITYGQDSTRMSTATPSVIITGYMEVYYSYNVNKPVNNNKNNFLYSHNRHNEFNLNLGFIKVSYASDRVRANLALAAGTYINANYTAESGVLKNVFEANAGLKLSKTRNLWLDAGIFSSHIGFESAVSKDCWNLTRSLMAENSPYYETGAKLSYTTDNNKWLLSVLALNGWQCISRLDGNSLMSVGTQIQFKPSANTTLNYSTFIGTNKPDSNRLMRYYHNLYAIFNAGKLGIISGFDIGMEQKFKGSRDMNTWLTPVLILKYPIAARWTVAARAEYYNDRNGVIIVTGTPNGFKTTGYSVNLDYAPVINAVLRLEARTFRSEDPIFVKSSGISNKDHFITGSIAVSF